MRPRDQPQVCGTLRVYGAESYTLSREVEHHDGSTSSAARAPLVYMHILPIDGVKSNDF